jgi:putative FmdB family regulatory protein
MAIKDFECSVCKHIFEKMFVSNDTHTSTCSKCGGSAFALPSAAHFKLNGSGWYNKGSLGRK